MQDAHLAGDSWRISKERLTRLLDNGSMEVGIGIWGHGSVVPWVAGLQLPFSEFQMSGMAMESRLRNAFRSTKRTVSNTGMCLEAVAHSDGGCVMSGAPAKENESTDQDGI